MVFKIKTKSNTKIVFNDKKNIIFITNLCTYSYTVIEQKSMTFVFILLFFFPLFFREKDKRITKVVVKSHAFLLDPRESLQKSSKKELVNLLEEGGLKLSATVVKIRESTKMLNFSIAQNKTSGIKVLTKKGGINKKGETNGDKKKDINREA